MNLHRTSLLCVCVLCALVRASFIPLLHDHIFYSFFFKYMRARRFVHIVCTILWTMCDIHTLSVRSSFFLSFLSIIFNRLYLLLRRSISKYRSHSSDILHFAQYTVYNVQSYRVQHKQHCI